LDDSNVAKDVETVCNADPDAPTPDITPDDGITSVCSGGSTNLEFDNSETKVPVIVQSSSNGDAGNSISLTVSAETDTGEVGGNGDNPTKPPISGPASNDKSLGKGALAAAIAVPIVVVTVAGAAGGAAWWAKKSTAMIDHSPPGLP
jgi:hypothetical protein